MPVMRKEATSYVVYNRLTDKNYLSWIEYDGVVYTMEKSRCAKYFSAKQCNKTECTGCPVMAYLGGTTND